MLKKNRLIMASFKRKEPTSPYLLESFKERQETCNDNGKKKIEKKRTVKER